MILTWSDNDRTDEVLDDNAVETTYLEATGIENELIAIWHDDSATSSMNLFAVIII